MPFERRIFAALALNEVVEPGHELLRIDVAVMRYGDRLHVFVVVVLEAVTVARDRDRWPWWSWS